MIRRLFPSLFALSLLLAAHDASAMKVDNGAEVIVVLLVGDVVLFVEDLQTAPQSRTYAVAETLVTTPQALLLGGFSFANAADRNADPIVSVVTTSASAFTATLATHGIWSWANRDKSSRDALGVSLIASLDGAFLGSMIAADLSGRARLLAPSAIFVGASTTTASLIGLGLDADHRAGWTALSVASGALLLHGVVSRIFDRERAEPKYHARFGPTLVSSPEGRRTLALALSGLW